MPDAHLGSALAGGAEELLHESDRTRVVRVPLADGSGSVICKQPRGSGAPARLRREKAILERLAGVDGVPRIAKLAVPVGMLALVDGGGRPLPGYPGPWQTGALLDLACGLTEVLAAVHARGVVHRDVSPANILLRDGAGPALVDYDLATTYAEERPAFGDAGALPYRAPEQTGRTGRPVDHRADLYGLGATLRELADDRVPAMLSRILARLLREEPDERYQSAEGLGYDLARLREGWRRGEVVEFALGERDFPARPVPPSLLVGRDRELATVRGAYAGAVGGSARGLLVTGAPGVGKTVLVEELRPLVAAAGGWYVSGRYDQYRRDLGADGVWHAFRALGRLLLAEPQERQAAVRTRLLGALGRNAGLVAAVLPEFETLLGVPAEPDESQRAPARISRLGLELVRTVAGPDRPLVFFVDDLQWAGPTALALLGALLGATDLPGVLVVGAYREAEVDPGHPLAVLLGRLRGSGGAPYELRLADLPPADLSALLAGMLRLPGPEAVPLADALGAATGGNPYDTTELVGALHRDGVLRRTAGGWHWDAGALRRYAGRGGVLALLGARVDALPVPTQGLLEVAACLGGEVELGLLRAAAGLSAAQLEQRLLPALEDGLLVTESCGDVVRFRHDRVQQAVYGRLAPRARALLRLSLARRLAAEPEYALASAHQYLPALDELSDAQERRSVAWLLRAAATGARLATNDTAAECFLAAAIRVLDPSDDAYLELEIEWHAALCSLGRFAEADELYASIERGCPDLLRRVDSTCLQIASLTNRNRMPEAVALGLEALCRLGVVVPPAAELGRHLSAGMDALRAWAAEGAAGAARDLDRAEVADPRALAVAKLVNRLLPAAFFGEQAATMAWLVFESMRRWDADGPCAALVGPLAHASFASVGLCGDFRTGYDAVRRVLAVSEARGYEPDTSQARFLYALSAGVWFEPLESTVELARVAREGLLQTGDVPNAGHTHYASVSQLLDCAPDLETYADEVDAALRFTDRTGNDQSRAAFVGYRRLIRRLTGEEVDAPAADDEATHVAGLAGNPTAKANVHLAAAVTALVLGDPAYQAHAAAAMPLLPFIQATYGVAVAHLLCGLAAAEQARTGSPKERVQALRRARQCRDWLAGRAVDQPANVAHLVSWLDAECAYSEGDFATAARGFDAALCAVAGRGRPWHAALIAERAAGFHLAHGMPHAAANLLARAWRGYAAWGATGKVRQLEREHPMLAGNVPADAGDPARIASLQHQLAEANRQLELLTVIDALTGLANRRRLAEVLDAEWRRGLRSGESIGLAMVDLDHFQLYNDHCGQSAGDECLRRVARALVASVRDTDLVARYGGEKFCVVMPGADANGARLVAQRLRAAVAALAVPHLDSPGGVVTLSAGIAAAVPAAPGGADHLVKLAEAALYDAKRAGRDRVAGPETLA